MFASNLEIIVAALSGRDGFVFLLTDYLFCNIVDDCFMSACLVATHLVQINSFIATCSYIVPVSRYLYLSPSKLS